MGRKDRPFERFCLILFLAFLLYMGQATAESFSVGTGEQGMLLPKQVGTWKLGKGPRRVEPKTIFDYMDGAGELYLGYRFRHLDVYDFRDPKDTQILAEVYQMETSDDAFGLLSLDVDGQTVEFRSKGAPAGQGVYGAGLLRLWSGDIFVRILAEKETPQSREAVMQLANAVTAGRTQGVPPAFVGALPTDLPGYKQSPRQVSFLRSYLVLNSIYFLSTRNILNLGLKTQAVTASYRSPGAGSKSARLLEISYDSPASAVAALRSFVKSYLPEHKCQANEKAGTSSTGVCLVEDGWLGYRLVDRTLALAFQLPSEQTARLWIDRAVAELQNWEKNHE